MTNTTTPIINPNVDWGTVIKNILFAGRYITNGLVSLLLRLGVPLSQDQIEKVGLVIILVSIYLIMTFAEKLKPIVRIAIVLLIGWIGLGFFM